MSELEIKKVLNCIIDRERLSIERFYSDGSSDIKYFSTLDELEEYIYG